MDIAQEKLKKRIFFRLEIDRIVGAPYLPGSRIHFQIGQPQQRGFLSAAAQQRSDTGGQFCEREWLNEVIVGASVQSSDLVIDSALCRQNEYQQFGSFGSNLAQKVQGGFGRQH